MDQKTTGELMQLLSSAKNISDLKQYTCRHDIFRDLSGIFK